jgi:excisionase family DNA binding protein
MSAVPKMPTVPRYGSAAQLAAYSGLSVKTVRRLVDSGRVRGLKVGRRLLIPFEDLDRHVISQADRSAGGRTPFMATTPTPTATARAPYVPPVSDEEQARSNRALVELLDSFESEGDEQEQRETMDVLRQALGKDRVASSRKLFP